MIAIDTNVLLRYLLDDDDAQSQAARRLVDETCSSLDPAFVHDVVLAELVWVLKRNPSSGRPKTVQTLRSLLENEHLAFSDDSAIAAAIDAYEAGPADFADYLVAAGARSHGATPTYTFDLDAAKSPAFVLMTL